jgi:hypothetical protein
VRALQNALIGDPLAPAAVAPLWDTPWHHPQWRERQQAVLANPQQFSHGLAAAGPPVQEPIPVGRHEQRWSGRIQATTTGGYSFTTSSGEVWPMITLEPSMHQWLSQHSGSEPVELIGHANPWGPWLRISRLAG